MTLIYVDRISDRIHDIIGKPVDLALLMPPVEPNVPPGHPQPMAFDQRFRPLASSQRPKRMSRRGRGGLLSR
jgi:hypothetical protein